MTSLPPSHSWRLAEKTHLNTCLKDVEQGFYRLVHVCGEDGLGKTQLVQSFISDLSKEASVLHVQGYASDYGKTTLRNTLWYYLGLHNHTTSEAQIAHLKNCLKDQTVSIVIPLWCSFLGINYQRTSYALSFDIYVKRLMESLIHWLQSQAKPLVVWLDRLDKKDYYGHVLKSLLYKTTDLSGVLVVHTDNQPKVYNPVAGVSTHQTLLHLKPLSKDDSLCLFDYFVGRLCLGEKKLTHKWRSMFIACLENTPNLFGKPLFVEQWLLALKQDNVPLQACHSLTNLMSERLAQLTHQEIWSLTLFRAAGGHLTHVACRGLGIDEDDLLSLCNEYILIKDDKKIEFRHDLFSLVLDTQLSAELKKSAHYKLATYIQSQWHLETISASFPLLFSSLERYRSIAWHFEQSDYCVPSIENWHQAADEAIKKDIPHEALYCFQKALFLMKAYDLSYLDEERERTIRDSYVENCHNIVSYSMRFYENALNILEISRTDQEYSEGLSLVAQFYLSNASYAEALEVLDEIKQYTIHDVNLAGHILIHQGVALFHSQDFRQSYLTLKHAGLCLDSPNFRSDQVGRCTLFLVLSCFFLNKLEDSLDYLCQQADAFITSQNPKNIESYFITEAFILYFMNDYNTVYKNCESLENSGNKIAFGFTEHRLYKWLSGWAYYKKFGIVRPWDDLYELNAPDYLKSIECLFKAELLIGYNRSDYALNLINQYLTINPRSQFCDPFILEIKSRVLRANNQYREAQMAMRQALALAKKQYNLFFCHRMLVLPCNIADTKLCHELQIWLQNAEKDVENLDIKSAPYMSANVDNDAIHVDE
jgi:hypothetical protein